MLDRMWSDLVELGPVGSGQVRSGQTSLVLFGSDWVGSGQLLGNHSGRLAPSVHFCRFWYLRYYPHR